MHAPILERRLHADVQRRQGQVRFLLRDDVVGQLEHDPQPLQQLVGRIHRAGLVVAAGQHGGPALQVDGLQNQTLRLQAGEADELFLLGGSGQRVAFRTADHDERLSGRNLVARDDRKLGSGERLQVPLQLTGHPTVEVVALVADHDHGFRLAAFCQKLLLG